MTNRNIFLEAVLEEQLSLIMEDEVYVESSTRSIIILGLLYDGVCLECLAMHSKSFAIIKLCLIFPYSAALLVFLSNHKTSDKEDNCRMKLCSSNVSWDSTDCKIMAFFNSRGSQFVRNGEKEAWFYL